MKDSSSEDLQFEDKKSKYIKFNWKPYLDENDKKYTNHENLIIRLKTEGYKVKNTLKNKKKGIITVKKTCY